MGRVGNIPRDLSRETAGSRVRSARLPKEDAGNKSRGSQTRAGASRAVKVKTPVLANQEPKAGRSVWEELGFSKVESANLEARSGLMMQIEQLIRANHWTQAQAAAQCRITQPRMSELLRGHIDRFSLDALVNIAAALGRRVRIELDAA